MPNISALIRGFANKSNNSSDRNQIMKLVVILTCFLFNLSLNGQISLIEFQELFLNNSKQSISLRYKKELINRNYKSSMNSLSPTMLFSLTPQYSKTISPITQPDGTIKDLGIHNISIAPTLTTTIPIWITGGSLSITNSLRYYRNINPQNTYSTYSMNYYYLSLSQPLSFYSSDKWNRKSAIAGHKMSKYQNSQENLHLKSLATSFFFNFLSLNNEIECIKSQLALSDTIITILDARYAVGNILSFELDEGKLYRRNKEISYKNLLIKKEFLINKLLNYFDSNIPDITLLEKPKFPQIDSDTTELRIRLKKKQEWQSRISTISSEYAIAEAKSKKRILPTLQVGIGNNGVGASLAETKENRSLSYNISLSFSIPILDIKEYDNQLKIAYIERDIKRIEEQIKYNNELIDLNETIQLLDEEYANYIFLNDAITEHEKKIKVYVELLSKGNVLFQDYAKILESIYSLYKSRIASLQKAYEYMDKIDELTFFDDTL